MHYINSDIRWQIAMIWSMLSSVMGHRRMKAFDVGNYYITIKLIVCCFTSPICRRYQTSQWHTSQCIMKCCVIILTTS